MARLALIATTLLLVACSGGVRDTRPELLQQADTFLAQGHSAYALAEYTAAAQRYHQALQAYLGIDHAQGGALARLGLANVALAQGQVEPLDSQLDLAARDIVQEGLIELLPRLDLLRAETAALHGERERAERLLTVVLAGASGEIAWSAQVQRCRLAAPEGLSACLDGLRPLLPPGDVAARARLERFEAQRAALQGEPEAADAHFRAALDGYRALADRPGLAATLTEWGVYARQRQAVEAAEERLRRALIIRTALQQRGPCIELLDQLVPLYAQLGRDSARVWAEEWRAHLRGAQETVDWEGLSGALAQL